MNLAWFVPPKRDGSGPLPEPVWPTDWPIPPVGTTVHIDTEPLKVSAIDFFPSGEEPGDDPCIYIVLEYYRPGPAIVH